MRGLGFLRVWNCLNRTPRSCGEQLALHDLIAQHMKAQEKRKAAEIGSEAIHR
jgi:hypothetical protein